MSGKVVDKLTVADLCVSVPGRRLVESAVEFTRRMEYDSLFLWTLEMLHAATRLYCQAGFELTESKSHRIWGQQLTEQRFELNF